MSLRLYSVYGPLEDRSRLIPTLVAEAAAQRLPPFVDPDTSRDFLYVDDAIRAFLSAAVLLRRAGTAIVQHGQRGEDHIRELAYLAKREFRLDGEPRSPRCRRRPGMSGIGTRIPRARPRLSAGARRWRSTRA